MAKEFVDTVAAKKEDCRKSTEESSDESKTRTDLSFDEDAPRKIVIANKARTKRPNIPLSWQQLNKNMKQEASVPKLLVDGAISAKKEKEALLEKNQVFLTLLPV